MSETTQRKHGNGSSGPAADLRTDLERARAINRGGDGGERRTSVWRRSTEAVLGRSPDDQRHFNDVILDLLDRWLGRLQDAGAANARLEARVQELTAARDHLSGRLDDEALRRREKEADRERGERLARKELDALRAAHDQYSASLEGLAARVEEAVSRLRMTARQATSRAEERDRKVRRELETFRGEVARILQAGENIRRSLIDAASRITSLERHESVLHDLPPRLERMEERLAAESEAAAAEAALRRESGLREELAAEMEALENRMSAVEALESGDNASIAWRLPVSEQDTTETAVSRASAVQMLVDAEVALRGTVLQIGVCRGSFLESCRAHRLPARGVEPDPAVEAECRSAGLDVVTATPLSYLRGLEPGCLGAVYSTRAVETLPPAGLADLLAAVHRVLAPGGWLVLDAMNAGSLSVLAGFYRDPARRRPVHAETVAVLLEAAGFERVATQRTDPAPEDARLPGVHAGPWLAPGLEPLRAQLNRQTDALNELLFGYRVQRVVGMRGTG